MSLALSRFGRNCDTVHASDQQNFEWLMTCSFPESKRTVHGVTIEGSWSVREATRPANRCAAPSAL